LLAPPHAGADGRHTYVQMETSRQKQNADSGH